MLSKEYLTRRGSYNTMIAGTGPNLLEPRLSKTEVRYSSVSQAIGKPEAQPTKSGTWHFDFFVAEALLHQLHQV